VSTAAAHSEKPNAIMRDGQNVLQNRRALGRSLGAMTKRVLSAHATPRDPANVGDASGVSAV
jgi:uncharacterized protein (DUF2062 family)